MNIGKTKDEMGKGIEVGNEKVMQEKAADILQLEGKVKIFLTSGTRMSRCKS